MRFPVPRHIFTLFVLTLFLIPASLLAAQLSSREFTPVQAGFQQAGELTLPYAPDRIMVKLSREAMLDANLPDFGDRSGSVMSTGLASLDELSASAGLTSISRPYGELRNGDLVEELGIDRWFIFEVEIGTDLVSLAAQFSSDANVETATLDWRAYPAVAPNDPYYPDQWGHNNTAQMLSYDWSTHSHTGPPVGTVGFDANAEAAWSAPQAYGSSGVVIAILDSGVDNDHPDLNQVAGYDFGSNDSDADDNSSNAGHGTACAGVAAGVADNGLGVSGIAGGCSIMPLKIANAAGSMYFSYIQNALYFAADNGADVASMSFSANITSDPATDAALLYAHNGGVTLLAATSNDNASFIEYPANNAYVIGVGAASPCGERKRSSSNPGEVNSGVSTDPNGYTCDGERWWGSNYGSTVQDAAGAVDVIAPTIMPTTDIGGSGGYDSSDYSMWFNGTSCATPYAAGVCGLIISANPTFTPTEVRDRLVSTAQDVISVESGAGWDRYAGYGMVDAEAAVAGSNPVPVANFNGSPLSGNVPLLVAFTDASSNADTWSWTFGDGGTSTAQNPSHTYNVAGVYTVSLTVTNAYGSDTETKVDYVNVTVPLPVAEFSGTPLSGDAPLDVSFTDTSVNADTWSWTFGDGGISTLQNPSHTYTVAGVYTVTLTVTNAYGNDTNTKVDYITVTEPGSGSEALAQSEASIYGTVSGSYLDTHAADSAYEVLTEELFIRNARKRYSHLEHSWNFNVASGSAVTFKVEAYRPANGDADDFLFEYSTDGVNYLGLLTVASATEQLYTASLPANTSGAVTIRVTDTNRVFEAESLDALYIDYMVIETAGTQPLPPVAAFSGSPTSGFAPLNVSFSDQSNNAPTSWDWDFGDGGSSTLQNPSHSYAAVGSYTVTLTVTNAYGSDSDVKTNYITVNENTGGTMHVFDIVVTRKVAGPNNSGVGVITIHDSSDQPLANATVFATATGPVGGTFSGLTLADGTVRFETGKTKSAASEWCFEVTDVSHASLTYDSGANLVTQSCESGDVQNAGEAYQLPSMVVLEPNFPDPFNPVTKISFSLPEAANVRIQVFDVQGRRIAVLVDEFLGEGRHSVDWNAEKASSGVYFYNLEVPGFSETRKMILLK